MMLDSEQDDPRFAIQLMAISREPELRQSVYDRLGEYCHQCRNRLNSLKLSLYLARRGASGLAAETWETLEAHYLKLEKLVERIQVICRPMTPTKIRVGLDLLVDDRRDDWSVLLAEHGGELVCVPPAERAVASLDVDRMGCALDALARWRAGGLTSGTITRLRWWSNSGRAHLAWEEDRPRSEPTAEIDAGVAQDRTWTLPLLARILAAHGGELVVEQVEGWRLEMSWPAGV